MKAQNLFKKLSLALSFALAGAAASAQETFWLNHVDPNMVEFDSYGRARVNHSTLNRSMSIGGQSFTNGLGTRATSQLLLDLQDKAQNFSAKVGIDDEIASGHGSVIFRSSATRKHSGKAPSCTLATPRAKSTCR